MHYETGRVVVSLVSGLLSAYAFLGTPATLPSAQANEISQQKIQDKTCVIWWRPRYYPAPYERLTRQFSHDVTDGSAFVRMYREAEKLCRQRGQERCPEGPNELVEIDPARATCTTLP